MQTNTQTETENERTKKLRFKHSTAMLIGHWKIK